MAEVEVVYAQYMDTFELQCRIRIEEGYRMVSAGINRGGHDHCKGDTLYDENFWWAVLVKEDTND